MGAYPGLLAGNGRRDAGGPGRLEGGEPMRAAVITPSESGSDRLVELPAPTPAAGELLVEVLSVGVDGTDDELVSGAYGEAPAGQDRVVIGHESLGRVREPAGELRAGQLVAAIVRRPDPVPCLNCAHGEWDYCRNGRYTQRGIKGRDGFLAEHYTECPDYVVAVPEELAAVGMVVEPTTIGEKALDGDLDRWRGEADELRAQILDRGVVEGRFRRAYDDDALDASLLMLPIVGFVDGADPLAVATLDAVREQLTIGGAVTDALVLRYPPGSGDGLAGSEGAFAIASFWLVEAVALAGRAAQARAAGDALVALQGRVGLYAEEFDPATGAHLGNIPQAFTHIGLINAALRMNGQSMRGDAKTSFEASRRERTDGEQKRDQRDPRREHAAGGALQRSEPHQAQQQPRPREHSHDRDRDRQSRADRAGSRAVG
jgi:hypothetical protein